MTDVPYLKLFRGERYQPRWEPGPKLRAAGLAGRALRADDGQWLSPEAARAEAVRLNAEAARRIAEGKRAPRGPRRHPRCMDALWETYRASPRLAKKADATRRDYAMKARVILDRFGEVPVAALEKAHLYSWWEELHAERGHAMANGILAVCRLLLSYAVLKGWRRDNPARELGIETVPPRLVIWLPAECEAFVATAERMGLTEVADAFVLGLHTSQRLSDVLALVEDRVHNGRVRLRQAKTGAHVTVPLTDLLATRLEAARRRRTAGPVVEINPRYPIVCRADGRVHDGSSYNKAFRAVRARIAADFPDVATRQFRDLRDTAVTRLAEAGCTSAEIGAITGHSQETIHQVMRHYLALSEQMATRGIDKLRAWMRDEAIAV